MGVAQRTATKESLHAKTSLQVQTSASMRHFSRVVMVVTALRQRLAGVAGRVFQTQQGGRGGEVAPIRVLSQDCHLSRRQWTGDRRAGGLFKISARFLVV